MTARTMRFLLLVLLFACSEIVAFKPPGVAIRHSTSMSLQQNKKNINHFDYFEGFDEELMVRLRNKLHAVEPNFIQQQALKCFRETNQNMVVVSQTGSGKTLTFLLPILQSLRSNPKARALVVAPSDILLNQHEGVATKLDVNASKRIVFASSVQDIQDLDDPALSTDISIVALDEVDAVLYGGSKLDDAISLTNFGETILNCYNRHSQVRFICTTAFLSRDHQHALLERDLPGAAVIREPVSSFQTDVLVPTLRQTFKYFSGDRMEKLANVLVESRNDEWLSQGSTIVFCGDVQQAQEAFMRLESNNNYQEDNDHHMILLHEELPKPDILNVVTRLHHLGDSSSPSTCTILCTDVAARGLDIANVRHVVLHSVPITISSFVHQVGRTARKGQGGLVTCLVSTASGDYQKYMKLHALKGASTLQFK